MKHRGPPLWLLRDIPAMAAMIASLWALIWQMLLTAFIAERNKRPASQSEIALVYGLLARAEEALAFALTRQAYRLIGFDTRSIERVRLDPPTDLDAFNTRFARYINHLLNLDAAARQAADGLRRRYRLNPRNLSTCLVVRPRHRVASLSRIATGGGGMRALARMSEGAASTRPNARGPPALPRPPTPHHLAGLTCETASACLQKSAFSPTRKPRPAIGARSFSGEA